MYFLQTSAKSCDNVDRLFTEIAHELLQQVFIFGQYWASTWANSVAKKYLVEIWSGNVCRQRPRTCRASRTVCRTYRTRSGKTPPKWNRTAAQKSSELSHSKLPESLWSLKIFLISPSFPDFRMPKSSSALISHMQRKCTFWKSSSKNKPPMRMNPNDTSSF